MSNSPQDPSAENPPAQEAAGDRSQDSEAAGTPVDQPRGKRRHRRAVDPGHGPEPVWHRTAWEDDPRAWGDGRDDSDSDQRILREKPPHW